jgi:hypothetical protein
VQAILFMLVTALYLQRHLVSSNKQTVLQQVLVTCIVVLENIMTTVMIIARTIMNVMMMMMTMCNGAWLALHLRAARMILTTAKAEHPKQRTMEKTMSNWAARRNAQWHPPPSALNCSSSLRKRRAGSR